MCSLFIQNFSCDNKCCCVFVETCSIGEFSWEGGERLDASGMCGWFADAVTGEGGRGPAVIGSQHQSGVSSTVPQTISSDSHQTVHQRALLERNILLQLPTASRWALRSVRRVSGIYTPCSKKGSHHYFLNNSVRRWPILVIIGMQHQEETWCKWL